MSSTSDQELADSWRRNAPAWTAAVREGRIASRRAGTDAAVLAALRALAPARLLDLGCGEGWLCRAMAAEGVACVGVDGSAPLVEAARAAGGGDFHVLDYAQLADAAPVLGRFDVVVANFAVMGQDLQALLATIAGLLRPDGALVLQTVHPAALPAGTAEGWQREDFSGFGDGFVAAMPWYYRPASAWRAAVAAAGFARIELSEPCAWPGGPALSLLWVARRA